MNNNLKTWHFDINNDKLVDLVLSGKKTATTCLYTSDISKIGEESILIYDNEKKACITKIKKIIIDSIKNITWDIAKLEGENDNLEEWKKTHEQYFKTIDSNFNENTKVVIKIFEVTQNLKVERLKLAKKIVDNNKDIFKEVNSIEEINAGFNNSIFNIDNKYVIKVCGNVDEENLFDTEYNFYKSNQNNIYIPKFYKYDDTKEIVPYVYEIIEKVKGQTVYYYWYKITEEEREKFIQKLIKIIKIFHKKEY